MRTPVTLSDVNQFTVVRIEARGDRSLLIGRLSQPGQPSLGQHFCLFISLEEWVSGRWSELDPFAGTGVLDVLTHQLLPAIVPGASFPTFDNYWSDRVSLVLDPSRTWQRKSFQSPDAFEQPSPYGGRMWRQVEPGDEDRTDGRIVPGGWDHEHCEICSGKIGHSGDAEGYVSDREEWVCMACYTRHVQRRDLSFLVAGGESDDDSPVGDDERVFNDFSRLLDSYDIAALTALFQTGANVDARSRYGWTPLMLAASRGHGGIVKLLLTAGADPSATSEQHSYTPLALAAQQGHLEAVQSLLDSGASVRLPNTFCNGSLLTFVKTGAGRNQAVILELLERAGAT